MDRLIHKTLIQPRKAAIRTTAPIVKSKPMILRPCFGLGETLFCSFRAVPEIFDLQ